MEDLATPSCEGADCAQPSTLKSGFQERLSLFLVQMFFHLEAL